MAAGHPFTITDIDRWLYGVLSVDALMKSYAPGGFWAVDPDSVDNQNWSSTYSYHFGDIANGIDGQPYRSLINSNVGNEPSASPSSWAYCFPCVRWWVQSPGRDTKRQDGQAGRVMSNPFVMVCMLDRQRGGSIDLVGGSNGNLEAASLRLVTLLDARNELVTLPGARTFQFTAYQLSAYQMVEPANGDFHVLVGHRYQLHIQ